MLHRTGMNGHNAPQGQNPLAVAHNALVKKVDSDVSKLVAACQQLAAGFSALEQRLVMLEQRFAALAAGSPTVLGAPGAQTVTGQAAPVAAAPRESASGTPMDGFANPEDANVFLSGGED